MTGLLLVSWMAADGAFAGYRCIAGRHARVQATSFALRAMFVGGAVGALFAGLLWAAVFLAGGLSPELERVGDRLLAIYTPYGAVVGLGFIARAVPHVDVRAATSILVFGPFTLLRWPWFVVGALWAVQSASWPVHGVVVAGLLVVRWTEGLLEHHLWRWLVPETA